MDIVNYLLGQAKEGEWILDDGVVSDTPIDVVITNLLRAKLLNGLPYEVPYVCKYEVEYLQENNFGKNKIELVFDRFSSASKCFSPVLVSD